MNKIKLFAASAVLAAGITLLPGCHTITSIENEPVSHDTPIENNSVAMELNDLNDKVSNYQTKKKIEKIYSKINTGSVKINEVLLETTEKKQTLHTTGKDLMILLEGKGNTAWFSSNITPSDAYSSIASLNEERAIKSIGYEDYLNPSTINYIIGNTNNNVNIKYSENGKLEISVPDEIEKMTICEVTPSEVKGLDDEETQRYILSQPTNKIIPIYALQTIRHVEQVPKLYSKDDILTVTYDGNYFETYMGFAEKDFSSIPFFTFEFNSLNERDNIIHKT